MFSNFPIKILPTVLVLLLSMQPAASAGEFARTLTPEKMRAAGLVKLTPEELAQLEELVQEYKAGEPANAPSAPAAGQTRPVADNQATPAATPSGKSSKILPAWVGALLTLERVQKKGTKAEAMESRIVGEFTGWEKRTQFRLENGQVWAQVNDDSYVHAPALQSPKVKITPASFGSFWMDVEGVNQPCRVKPVRME